MARAYYGTRISENMTRTPEGYLICHNVPLARTGWYEYEASEIGVDASGMVNVFRSPDEVFNDAAIASFEGKTVSDGHPSEYPITPSNESAYYRGHVQNVRKGAGEFEDCMIGDLFVKDAVLINKIENGLREVSCGYDCEWLEKDDGTYEQKQIRGNHVAVVQNGRAGDRISIRDAATHHTTTKKRSEKMAFDLKKVLGMGFKAWAADAEPEAVANAIEAAKGGEEKAKDALPGPGGGEGDNPMMAILQQILSAIQQMGQAKAPAGNPPEKDALEELEGELQGGEQEDAEDVEGFMRGGVFHPIRGSEGYSNWKEQKEGKVKKWTRHDSADELADTPTLPEEDRPDNPIPGADSKQMVLAAIKAVKPVIAAIKDEKERKAATDALAKSLRDTMKPGSQKGAYGDLLRTQKAVDEKARTQAAKDEEYGKGLKEKYHRKPIAGGK